MVTLHIDFQICNCLVNFSIFQNIFNTFLEEKIHRSDSNYDHRKKGEESIELFFTIPQLFHRHRQSLLTTYLFLRPPFQYSNTFNTSLKKIHLHRPNAKWFEFGQKYDRTKKRTYPPNPEESQEIHQNAYRFPTAKIHTQYMHPPCSSLISAETGDKDN